jgi:hypothetical protein
LFLFSLSFLFRLIANSPRRDCHRLFVILHGLPSNKNIRIPTYNKKLGRKRVYFERLSKGSKTSDMTSEGLGEGFESDVRRKISVSVDGGTSKQSSVQQTVNEDPHRINPIMVGLSEPQLMVRGTFS